MVLQHLAFWLRSVGRFFRGREEGFSLLEGAISIVLLGVVAASYLGGLDTAYRTAALANEKAVAQNLAITQTESVKLEDYIDWVPGHGSYAMVDPSPGYTISLDVVAINPATGASLGGTDLGMQKVTVSIVHRERTVFTLVDYKVYRPL